MSTPEAPPIREFDARPLLRAGEEPLQAIMNAVDALAPGESLRLIAPFRPVPLFSMMANRGFSANDRPLHDGDWEIVFSPIVSVQKQTKLSVGSSTSAIFWSSPIEELDLIDLDPSETTARILETIASLQPGDVLFALLAREPVLLFPELVKRRHEWAGNFDAAGTAYRLLVRHGGE